MYASGIQAQYSYSPFGRATAISQSVPADFQYDGYYFHPRSNLNLALRRTYSGSLDRWISRDPVGEEAGTNLYAFVLNHPIDALDPDGLDIYLMRGNLGASAWTVNRYVHESVCVDIWSCGCKKVINQVCYSFYFSAPFVKFSAPSNSWVGLKSLNSGVGLKGTVIEEDPDTNTSTVKVKKTTCKEDRAFLRQLSAVRGMPDTYKFLRHSCVDFAEMMFNQAPGNLVGQ